MKKYVARLSTRKFWMEVCSALIILLFIYTGLSKLQDYAQFKFALETSPWQPLSSTAATMAWFIPVLEIIIAAMLIFEKTVKMGFVAAGLLLSAFTIYLTVLILSGMKLPCSCGGVISQMSWKTHIYFNLVFILVAATGYLLKRKAANVLHTL